MRESRERSWFVLDFNDRRIRVWGIGIIVIVLTLTTYFCLEKSVTIKADDRVIKCQTFKNTVGEVLKEKNIQIYPHDQVKPGLDSELKEKMEIVVTRAFPITVIADGRSQELVSVPVKVDSALKQAGVTLGEKDLVSSDLQDLTYKGQVIRVTRVVEKNIEVMTSIPFTRQWVTDSSLEVGLTRTVSRGRSGQARQVIKITYHDGQEVKRQVISSEVTRTPVNEVVARGTITTVSRGGLRLDLNRALVAMSTAYTYTGRNTATGKRPAVGMVAVDPRVIPLGSRLYIEGYGFAVAADRGSSIKGEKIDVFLESEAQCRKWGRRPVKVYILK